MSQSFQIALLEPFYGGSHRAWADGLKRHSKHRIEIFGLPDRYWKWRMHGAAVTLAEQYLECETDFDLIIASDMLHLPTFLALVRCKAASTPVAIYFHENQITYPWSPDDEAAERDQKHYGYINYLSALASDKCYFNSEYHKRDFLETLPEFLKCFPDYRCLDTVARITDRSETLELALDLRRFDQFKSERCALRMTLDIKRPLLLWNHRWEYDKNPRDFFAALYLLKESGVSFQLAVLGEEFKRTPPEFAEARERLAQEIVHWGFVDSFAEYAAWCWAADILPVTSNQDFFGMSVVEAVYCGCHPLLPNRLNYPYLFTGCDEYELFLYRDQYDLVEKLANFIEDTSNPKLSLLAEQYDWSVRIGSYDRYFESLVSVQGGEEK